MVTERLSTEKEMLSIGKQFAKTIDQILHSAPEHQKKLSQKGVMIFLHGTLGTGKTTFARGFLEGLGCRDKVKSPTYTLIESYELADREVHHFDFYRLSNPDELNDIGAHDYFSSSAICLIEWPEKGFPLLPQADLCGYFSFDGEGRKLRFEAVSLLGEEILAKLP